MSEGYRNTYSRKVYSHGRQERRLSPVPLFDQVFGMGKPVLRDIEQAIDLSVKKVNVETTDTTKANKDPMKKKQMPVLSSPSTDNDDVIDLLSERTSFYSDVNAEDISDRELSLIRAHMSNADSEDARCSSQSLTVTFVLTSATDSSSSATDSMQPVEMPRQTANGSGIQVYSLINLSADAVKEDEKGYESPQEVFDLSDSGLDADGIRSSTPVNNSQIQLQLFDSLSTISELQNNRERDEEDEVKVAEIMADSEEESEEDEEEEQGEEEEAFSHATQNEMTPPRPNKQSACPSISLKHSLRYRKKDKSKKLRSSRCIFPGSVQEQVFVTKSSELTQQAKELLGYPLSMKQLTSTPISFRGNQDDYCLPHPAISTITITDPHDSSTAREPNEKEAKLEMSLATENQEKQDLTSRDHAAGHRHLTSTPFSFLKNKIDSCLPPVVSAITILEPHHCIHSTELESNVEVAEPERLVATRKQETLHEPCRPSLAEPSSEGRIIWEADCCRQAKRCRISADETGSPETLENKHLLNLPVLKPPYMVGPDRWNIPYKTTEGQICEHKDMELCSVVRLPFVKDDPVPLLQCIVQKNAITSYSPDFLESF